MSTHVQPILATVLLSIVLSDRTMSYLDFLLWPSPVTCIDWQLLLDFALSPSYFISDDCSSLGHQLWPPLSYSSFTNSRLVWTFEFPPSCPFFGLGNSLANSEVLVYTLLPWPVTSSAACTYPCLPLAAQTLINSGLFTASISQCFMTKHCKKIEERDTLLFIILFNKKDKYHTALFLSFLCQDMIWDHFLCWEYKIFNLFLLPVPCKKNKEITM